MQFIDLHDTICAISTPAGTGAIAVIRVSGSRALSAVDPLFSKSLAGARGYSLHYGEFREGSELIDEVMLAVFRAPRSFTGEDVVEISCHGSQYIQGRILQALTAAGCRPARPGEFSMRAFANGKMDLSRTEAIADLISSSTKSSHRLAMNQMRGGFSKKINELRERLIHFASLIELELDFSEEDVEFADREDLRELVEELRTATAGLVQGFSAGRAIKNGIPVAILGAPNVGKSTLLNALLEEDRAIVSSIAGTTRDSIEDTVTIDGVLFRFIDTAGIRDTADEIERIGIRKAFEHAGKASVILYLIDATADMDAQALAGAIAEVKMKTGEDREFIALVNKVDMLNEEEKRDFADRFPGDPPLLISAEKGAGMDALHARLSEVARSLSVEEGDVLVSNARHHDALTKTLSALDDVARGLATDITGDFLASDIRRALHHLGEITGEVTTDDLLGNIFSKFCIGK